ncbi:hypothetical protein D9R12_03045 [Pseudoxanthomonas spadix]|nr:hypothetical protein D9R12_03045 [Pseudoxanthomonas spadix]
MAVGVALAVAVAVALALALAVAVAVALALALALALLSLSCLSRKASRASQEVRAEEAPLSERSEFGRRARTSEKRRGPPRSGGSRPASSGFASFCQDKRKSRCKRESLAFDSRFSWLDQWITGRIKSFHVASRRELLLSRQK